MAVIRGIQADDGGWSDGYKDYDKASFKSTVFVYDENNEQIFYNSIKLFCYYKICHWSNLPSQALFTKTTYQKAELPNC